MTGARHTLRLTRAARHLLHRPPGLGVDGIVHTLLAVQSQDTIQGRRSLRARGEGFTAADVDAAIVEQRSIVMAWLNRGTIHMVAREDYPWLLGLTAPTQLTASRRRLAQLGFSEAGAERGVHVLAGELGEGGPLTRRELRERVAARGLAVEGQAFVHLLFRAALGGLVVIGPLVEGRPGVALARDWLGEEAPATLAGEARDAALGELARRYLVAHGPASDRDLAWWAGLPLRDARAGLAAVELVEHDGGLVDLRRPPVDATVRSGLRLLPMWDAYLLGWPERDFLVSGRDRPRVYGGGTIGPAVVVDGRVAGTWRARRESPRLRVETEAFRRLPKRALEAEIADLARFEGLNRRSATAGAADGKRRGQHD